MNIKNFALVLLNTITFLLMIFINYASNTGMFGGVTVAEIAHKYDTLFAPADYAFAIWGVIFLLSAAFVIYQWVIFKNDINKYIQRTGVWFAISNIANCFWVYCWVHEWLGLSVFLILVLLISLIILVIKLRLELDDEPVLNIFFVWWPIAIYVGWIMVATIACIASWLVSIEWSGFGISAATWCIIMIVITLLLYMALIQKRNLRESASVAIWAFIAIAVRQWNVHTGIVIAAASASIILTILTALHGYKNRYYAPFAKIKRSEWK